MKRQPSFDLTTDDDIATAVLTADDLLPALWLEEKELVLAKLVNFNSISKKFIFMEYFFIFKSFHDVLKEMNVPKSIGKLILTVCRNNAKKLNFQEEEKKEIILSLHKSVSHQSPLIPLFLKTILEELRKDKDFVLSVYVLFKQTYIDKKNIVPFEEGNNNPLSFIDPILWGNMDFALSIFVLLNENYSYFLEEKLNGELMPATSSFCIEYSFDANLWGNEEFALQYCQLINTTCKAIFSFTDPMRNSIKTILSKEKNYPIIIELFKSGNYTFEFIRNNFIDDLLWNDINIPLKTIEAILFSFKEREFNPSSLVYENYIAAIKSINNNHWKDINLVAPLLKQLQMNIFYFDQEKKEIILHPDDKKIHYFLFDYMSEAFAKNHSPMTEDFSRKLGSVLKSEFGPQIKAMLSLNYSLSLERMSLLDPNANLKNNQLANVNFTDTSICFLMDKIDQYEKHIAQCIKYFENNKRYFIFSEPYQHIQILIKKYEEPGLTQPAKILALQKLFEQPEVQTFLKNKQLMSEDDIKDTLQIFSQYFVSTELCLEESKKQEGNIF